MLHIHIVSSFVFFLTRIRYSHLSLSLSLAPPSVDPSTHSITHLAVYPPTSQLTNQPSIHPLIPPSLPDRRSLYLIPVCRSLYFINVHVVVWVCFIMVLFMCWMRICCSLYVRTCAHMYIQIHWVIYVVPASACMCQCTGISDESQSWDSWCFGVCRWIFAAGEELFMLVPVPFGTDLSPSKEQL